MLQRALARTALVALVLSGCALDRAGLAPDRRLDGGGTEIDAGGGTDSGIPTDSGGIEVDSGTSDAGRDGGSCVPRCEGTVAVACGRAEVRVDCASTAMVCVGAGVCAPTMVCSPGATRCSGDGAAVLTCEGDGASESSAHCDRGCEGGECRPEEECLRPLEETVTSGTTRYDLCGGGADNDHATIGGDCDFVANGEEVMVPLDVDRPGNYRIDIVDAPGGPDVDPILYVRAICGDRASEVGCNDDRSDDVLSSRLDVALEAGRYFVVVDSIDTMAPGNGCGVVDLTITRL